MPLVDSQRDFATVPKRPLAADFMDYNIPKSQTPDEQNLSPLNHRNNWPHAGMPTEQGKPSDTIPDIDQALKRKYSYEMEEPSNLEITMDTYAHEHPLPTPVLTRATSPVKEQGSTQLTVKTCMDGGTDTVFCGSTMHHSPECDDVETACTTEETPRSLLSFSVTNPERNPRKTFYPSLQSRRDTNPNAVERTGVKSQHWEPREKSFTHHPREGGPLTACRQKGCHWKSPKKLKCAKNKVGHAHDSRSWPHLDTRTMETTKEASVADHNHLPRSTESAQQTMSSETKGVNGGDDAKINIRKDAKFHNAKSSSTESKQQGSRLRLSSEVDKRCFSLHKGNDIYVGKVTFRHMNELSMRLLNALCEEDNSTENFFEKKICIRYMIDVDVVKSVFQRLSAAEDYGIAAFEFPDVGDQEPLRNLMQYLGEKRRVGVVTFTGLAGIIIPGNDASAILHKDLDSAPYLYCSLLHASHSPSHLGMSKPPRNPSHPKISLPAPMVAMTEYRKLFLRAVHRMPPNIQWIVEGKRIHFFAPSILATSEVKWLLEQYGAKVDDNTAECEVIMVHRWFHYQIHMLPGLNNLKKAMVTFVLWGLTLPQLVRGPEVLFPGDGGIITFTTDVLMADTGPAWLRMFQTFLQKSHPISGQWGVILHPSVWEMMQQLSQALTEDEPFLYRVQEVYFILQSLKLNGLLRIGQRSDVYDHPEEQQRVYHMLVRLQYSWSLNFRHFVCVSLSANRAEAEVVEGIDQLSPEEFSRHFIYKT
ncbi:uncharacterized protein SPPG_06878 [Spizellomyces punctatus DAOM BR117]|uniref:Uncharacterized protein n=1 Tax=Spizellomyces punctatus (strain DAOM BR117) TaxID=645134 RepID=A0A0L0H9L7_SPIPD|nr:uncharacterized protein SPPG_06878 [Spizellomyces punctatus DAOM BR117]KNC97887.1 hypothetical protein SPPG_06878 [Spizellomyces punctatus DAOM BR117]|eukprot:XP_016605927.1 hypothetical protein SPPG_06878 [Spizellomyces punctatus DAOM BR117]